MDRRNSAYPFFTHYIEENVFRIARTTWVKAGVDQHKDKNFFTLREWFWTQLGPSKEWRYWSNHAASSQPGERSQNQQWCWDTEFNKQRIYVTPMALMYFNLQWS